MLSVLLLVLGVLGCNILQVPKFQSNEFQSIRSIGGTSFKADFLPVDTEVGDKGPVTLDCLKPMDRSSAIWQRFHHQVCLLNSLPRREYLQIYGLFKQKFYLCSVMQDYYMNAFEYVIDRPAQKKRVLKEMLLAARQLTRDHLYHLNLRLDNFVMVNGHVKLKGFEYAVNTTIKEGKLPIKDMYTIPSIKRKLGPTYPLSTSIDMYALGVCLTQIMSGVIDAVDVSEWPHRYLAPVNQLLNGRNSIETLLDIFSESDPSPDTTELQFDLEI